MYTHTHTHTHTHNDVYPIILMHITIACMKVKVWLPSNLQVEAAHTKLRMILSMPAQQRSTDPSCSHMKSDTSSRLTRAYLNHYV